MVISKQPLTIWLACTLGGTVKLKGCGKNWHARLPLMQLAGARTHSTFAWLRFSVHGDGGTGYCGVNVEEIGDRVMDGDENAGDVELI